MPNAVTFGTLGEANDFRDRVGEYLARGDDRRSKTVRFTRSTPNSILERAEQTAFVSSKPSRESAGMTELTDREQRSLGRQHRSFTWRQHGLEAMRVKAAMQRKGVTEWQDYYEPGEGVSSSLKKLQAAKNRAGRGGGRTAVGGKRTDEEEMSGRGRRQRQTEQVSARELESAKRPAIVSNDKNARDFLREESRFNDDLWAVTFGGSDRWGRPEPSGQDFELLEERHEQRSRTAQAVDEVKAAPKTRDPLKWAGAPAQYDFPGIDTVDPAKVQEGRSDRARAADTARDAELAPRSSPRVTNWVEAPGRYDLPGVDTDAADGVIDETPTLNDLFGGSPPSLGDMPGFDDADAGHPGVNPGVGGGKTGMPGVPFDDNGGLDVSGTLDAAFGGTPLFDRD